MIRFRLPRTLFNQFCTSSRTSVMSVSNFHASYRSGFKNGTRRAVFPVICASAASFYFSQCFTASANSEETSLQVDSSTKSPSTSSRTVVIAVTGGIASGKSNITRLLQENGVVTIDADKVGHEVYTKGTKAYQKIVETFGDKVVADDGAINRKVLGSMVFGNPDEMKKLTDIVWPEIGSKLLSKISDFRNNNNDVSILAFEAAVLVEAQWQHIPDIIWLVEVSEEVAVQRLMDRNKLSKEDALARIKSQTSNEERRKYSHVVFNSDCPKEETEKRVLKELEKLRIDLGLQQ